MHVTGKRWEFLEILQRKEFLQISLIWCEKMAKDVNSLFTEDKARISNKYVQWFSIEPQ